MSNINILLVVVVLILALTVVRFELTLLQRQKLKNRDLLVQFSELNHQAECLESLRQTMLFFAARVAELHPECMSDPVFDELTVLNKKAKRTFQTLFKENCDAFTQGALRYNSFMKATHYRFCDVRTLPQGAQTTLPRAFDAHVCHRTHQ